MLVTFLAEAGVPGPVIVDGRPVLEAASPAVWFTFPGARHDIGRFHTPGGRFTGYYANILTPVEVLPRGEDGAERWRTTDLFLDVFVTPAGEPFLLDVEELDAALARGWIDPDAATSARAEADRLIEGARSGTWPPPVVDAWPLERARAAARPDRHRSP